MDDNELERLDHKAAYESAIQSVCDAAAHLTEYGAWNEAGDMASVLLGRLQDLTDALETARTLGWMTTDEHQDTIAMFYGKGTGL